MLFYLHKAFPHSSVGKESTCNAGDPGSIPGSGRSPGEGIGYPLQYSWVSLMVQLVKNLPAMWETLVWSLGWEDPLETGKAAHSSILAWRIPWTVESMGLQKVGHNFHFHFFDTEVGFLILSCMSCLCSFNINPLSTILFANIFSHSVGCFFSLTNSFLCF